MNPKKHFEEIRHLFWMHTQLMLEIAYKMGPDVTQEEIDQILVDVFFKAKDPNEHKEPLKRINFTSRRADIVPVDVESAREDGEPREIPVKFRKDNPDMPEYSEELNINADYPENDRHQDLVKEE